MRTTFKLTFSGITAAIVVVILSVLIGGCTLERRHYRNGFYVAKPNRTEETHAEHSTVVGQIVYPLQSDTSNSKSEKIIEIDSAVQVVELPANKETNRCKKIPQKNAPNDNVLHHHKRVVKPVLHAAINGEKDSPVDEIFAAIFLVLIFIAAIGLLTELYIVLFAAMGLGLLLELIAAILITVKLVKPKSEVTEEVKRDRKRAVIFALTAIVLFVGFVALASMLGLVGLVLALLSFVSIVLALRFAQKSHSSTSNENIADAKDLPTGNESYRPYIFALIAGWIAIIATLAGILLLPTAVSIGISIVLLCAGFGLGLYTLVKARQRKKRGENLSNPREEKKLSTLLLTSVFLSVLSVVASSLAGLLGLLLLLLMGGW